MRAKRRLWGTALGILLAVHNTTSAAQTSPPHPFQLVMIDAASEARLGAFPIDRVHIANAINNLSKAGAKAVVLKFFYDLPSNHPASDIALANAMAGTKVLLQARIDDNEPNLNLLPARFLFNAPAGPVAIGGLSGWLPLPMLANAAHAVGFVDVVSVDKVPAYERYLDRNVKSLTIAALQVALDDVPLVIRPGKEVVFGNKRLVLDQTSQIVLTPFALDDKRDVNKISALSLVDIVDGNFKRDAVDKKVVVIAYDGGKMPQLKTPLGQMKAHHVFWLGLIDGWRQLKPISPIK